MATGNDLIDGKYSKPANSVFFDALHYVTPIFPKQNNFANGVSFIFQKTSISNRNSLE